MVNKFTEEVISQSLDELKEVIAGTDISTGRFVVSYGHITKCPKLQQFLIEASVVQCPHFIHGILLGMIIIKNQEQHNITKELENLFTLGDKDENI